MDRAEQRPNTGRTQAKHVAQHKPRLQNRVCRTTFTEHRPNTSRTQAAFAEPRLPNTGRTQRRTQHRVQGTQRRTLAEPRHRPLRSTLRRIATAIRNRADAGIATVRAPTLGRGPCTLERWDDDTSCSNLRHVARAKWLAARRRAMSFEHPLMSSLCCNLPLLAGSNTVTDKLHPLLAPSVVTSMVLLVQYSKSPLL